MIFSSILIALAFAATPKGSRPFLLPSANPAFTRPLRRAEMGHLDFTLLENDREGSLDFDESTSSWAATYSRKGKWRRYFGQKAEYEKHTQIESVLRLSETNLLLFSPTTFDLNVKADPTRIDLIEETFPEIFEETTLLQKNKHFLTIRKDQLFLRTLVSDTGHSRVDKVLFCRLEGNKLRVAALMNTHSLMLSESELQIVQEFAGREENIQHFPFQNLDADGLMDVWRQRNTETIDVQKQVEKYNGVPPPVVAAVIRAFNMIIGLRRNGYNPDLFYAIAHWFLSTMGFVSPVMMAFIAQYPVALTILGWTLVYFGISKLNDITPTWIKDLVCSAGNAIIKPLERLRLPFSVDNTSAFGKYERERGEFDQLRVQDIPELSLKWDKDSEKSISDHILDMIEFEILLKERLNLHLGLLLNTRRISHIVAAGAVYASPNWIVPDPRNPMWQQVLEKFIAAFTGSKF
jgi:hypothetical protein